MAEAPAEAASRRWQRQREYSLAEAERVLSEVAAAEALPPAEVAAEEAPWARILCTLWG